MLYNKSKDMNYNNLLNISFPLTNKNIEILSQIIVKIRAIRINAMNYQFNNQHKLSSDYPMWCFINLCANAECIITYIIDCCMKEIPNWNQPIYASVRSALENCADIQNFYHFSVLNSERYCYSIYLSYLDKQAQKIYVEKREIDYIKKMLRIDENHLPNRKSRYYALQYTKSDFHSVPDIVNDFKRSINRLDKDYSALLHSSPSAYSVDKQIKKETVLTHLAILIHIAAICVHYYYNNSNYIHPLLWSQNFHPIIKEITNLCICIYNV